MRLNLHEVRLKRTEYFLFEWRGPLVIIFGGVGGGVRRARWGGGSGARGPNCREW